MRKNQKKSDQNQKTIVKTSEITNIKRIERKTTDKFVELSGRPDWKWALGIW